MVYKEELVNSNSIEYDDETGRVTIGDNEVGFIFRYETDLNKIKQVIEIALKDR